MCGQMSVEKSTAMTQKLAGLIRPIELIMVSQFKSLQNVHHVVRQILLSFMLTKKVAAQINIVVNAIKLNAKIVGTQSLNWIVKHLEHISTELLRMSSKPCTKPNKVSALFVLKSLKRSVASMLTTTMKPVKYEDCYATVAMWRWVLLRKM